MANVPDRPAHRIKFFMVRERGMAGLIAEVDDGERDKALEKRVDFKIQLNFM